MKENKKMISFLIAAIVISSGIATAVTFGMKYFEEEKEKLPLFVKIFVDKKEGYPPHSVNFTSLIDNYEGNLKYSWNFGDREFSEEINPSHTYEETGTYTCTAEVTDSSGKKSSNSIDILVKRNKPPVVTISINQNTLERKFIPILSSLPLWPGDIQKIVNILEGRNPYIFGEGRIVCTAQVSDPEDDEIVSYKWKHEVEKQLSKRFEPEEPIHHFEGNKSIRLPEIYTWPRGRHVVKLLVEDSAGNTANASIEFQVEDSPKKIKRQQIQRMIMGTLNSWIVYGKPFLGPAVAALLLASWKLNNFTGMKLVALLVLTFVFQLDLGDQIIMGQAKTFLKDHPLILNTLKKTLIRIQDKLKETDSDSPMIETIQKLLEDLDLANKRPIVTNPKPENNHDNIDIDNQNVSIAVADPEGDPFNVTISGDYVNYIAYPQVYNGTFNATLIITPLPYDTDVYWHVNVSYAQDRWVNKTYMFKTRFS